MDIIVLDPNLHAFLSAAFTVRENVDCCNDIKQSYYLANSVFQCPFLVTFSQFLTIIKNNI